MYNKKINHLKIVLAIIMFLSKVKFRNKIIDLRKRKITRYPKLYIQIKIMNLHCDISN